MKAANKDIEDVFVKRFGFQDYSIGMILKINTDTKVVTISIPANENFDDETGIIVGDMYFPKWMADLFYIKTFVQRERRKIDEGSKDD